MSRKYLFLLKKEVKDFVYSYKCWGVCLLLAFLQKIFSLCDITIDFYFYFWFVTTAIAQYVYDSYLTDIKEKGFLFLHNMGIGFYPFIISKLIFALLLGFVLVLFQTNLFIQELKWYDSIWLLLIVLFAALAMFLFSIITGASEMGGTALACFLCLGLLFVTYTLHYFALRCLFLTLMDFVLLFLSKRAYSSITYRSQI